jgi:hypothetical protein
VLPRQRLVADLEQFYNAQIALLFGLPTGIAPERLGLIKDLWN